MSILDLLLPKWRHSDASVRLKAVEQLSVDRDVKGLKRVLEKDPSEEVRLAAARRIGRNMDLLRELVVGYKGKVSERGYEAIALLARGNPSIAPSVARDIAKEVLVEAFTLHNPSIPPALARKIAAALEPARWALRGGDGERVRIYNVMPFLIPVLKSMGEAAAGAVPEIREDLETLHDIVLQAGGWSVGLVHASDTGVLTVLPTPYATTRVTVDLESVWNQLLDLLGGIGSEEAGAVLKEMTQRSP